MDIQEIRRQNLRALIQKDKEGTIASYGVKHGIEPSYISQVLGGHRAFGERSARNMEKKIGLSAGSLDDPSTLTNQTISELDHDFGQPKSRSIYVKSLAQIIDREQGARKVIAPDDLPENAVAYYLVNDSMEGVGREYIPRGSTLYIDEGAKPEPGEIALASIAGSEVIGEYFVVAGKPYLRPYNKQYQAVDIGDAVIAGVLCGVYWPRPRKPLTP